MEIPPLLLSVHNNNGGFYGKSVQRLGRLFILYSSSKTDLEYVSMETKQLLLEGILLNCDNDMLTIDVLKL